MSALCGNGHPQILALFSVEDSLFHIYNMKTQVEPLVRTNHIGFTSKSSNIMIGRYIVVQRKGSSKDHAHNDVQVKMRVKKFFNEIEPLCYYQL